MNSESDAKGRAPPRRQVRTWRARWHRADRWVPTAAIAAVAVAGLLAAVMTQYRPGVRPDESPAKVTQGSGDSSAAQNVAGRPVVQAPPLQAQPPAPTAQAQPNRGTAASDVAANALGAGPACKTCGVVETVIAIRSGSGSQPATGYLMQIRMDDGTVRMVEQRGAMPAGSRVIVEGDTVRLSRTHG